MNSLVYHFAWPLIVGVVSISAQAQSVRRVSFSEDVAPILTNKCMQCHGQTPLMGGLDLRSRATAVKGGQHGPAVIPGQAAASSLYRHLTGQEQPLMPLGGHLSEPEISTIKDWIEGGAAWDNLVTLRPGPRFTEQQRRYWAFQKVVKPAVPAVKARNPIDAFILS